MDAPRRRIALRLQYHGAAFAGSQRQPNARTVQAALEAAAQALTGRAHRADLAGRTDAGVHALGQVAALTTTAALTPRRWVAGLNHFLPPALAVQAARPVPIEFDPRRWAREREYGYCVRRAAAPQPLWADRAWLVADTLDPSALRAALALLVGEHDFASFAGNPGGAATVRTLFEASLFKERGGLQFRFRAPSFLPHQVRRMVGQVVAIGRGRGTPQRITELLAEPRTGAAGPSAPPQGLYLVRVRYDRAELEGWDYDDQDLFAAGR